MKIESSSLKPFTTDVVPAEFTEYIEKLKASNSVNEFVQLLDKANEWCNVFGKTEMGRWIDVLNRCDNILETAIHKSQETGSLAIDNDESFERPVVSVLRFTWLLFENSFTRSVYSSMDRLLQLLDCTKMSIVVQALRLLLIISKSSRYISQHMSHDDQQILSMKLTAITECWNGKHLRNLDMKDCCGPESPKADVFHLTYRTHSGTKDFHIDHKWSIEKARTELQTVLNGVGSEIDESEKILVFTRIRLVYSFTDYHARMYSVMARLISISVLFYSRCLLDETTINYLASDSLIEQICSLVYLNNTPESPLLDTVKTEALKTLASIVFLEKPRKIQLVVDNLGLNSYHGFTTTLMRRCVETLKAGLVESQGDFSVNFVTALFSLLYHVCGYDYGSDSLISCSMVEILLGVVQTYTLPESQISFVTRSVRIIDILTGIDATDFNSHDGMNVIVNRFIYEVDACKHQLDPANPNKSTICHQQRTALMKSLLNFLKRSVVDTNFAAQIRRIMEGNLPAALIHTISNPQFYGSSLLHSAIQLTTSFIYQEPAQLTLLQDKGLTDTLISSIFHDDFPISRDIIMSLPNICSALCLNERGLKSFNEKKPLQRIFRIIFSTKFLSSIRKRKNEIFDTATTLGAAFDELMRHQPTLRKDVVAAFCHVLDEIIKLANSDPYRCVISSNQSKWVLEMEEPSKRTEGPAEVSNEDSKSVSDDEVSEEIDASTSSTSRKDSLSGSLRMHFIFHGSKVLPLGDYLTITGKLLEAILTNSGSNENGQAVLDGEMPDRLVRFLTLKKPPYDILHSNFLSTVASILRYILQQTNKVQPIGVLLSNLTKQLEEFSKTAAEKRYSTATEFIENHSKPETMHLLIRLGCLIQVMTNFIKNAQSNQWESRTVMLTYLTTIDSGKQSIQAMFDAYRTMNWQLGLIDASNALPKTEPSKAVDEEKSDEPKAMEDATQTTENEESTSAPPETKETPAQPSGSTKNISQMLGKSHRHLAEIINLVAKLFFGGMQRSRRGVDSAYMKHANTLAESLFTGLNELMKWDASFPEDSFHFYMGNSLTLVRKLLFFDDHRSPHFMLPFFYMSKCHQSFFKLSDVFLAKGIKDDTNPSLISWLCIVQRLISVESVLYVKNKNDRVLWENFDIKKYLAVCQNDAMKSLTKLFDMAMVSDSEDRTSACKLVDRVICVLQELVHAMVQLNQSEQSKEPTPNMDALMNEVDEEKVQALIEMGFLRTDAVDALLQFSTVPEATEYLLTFNNAASSSANEIRQPDEPTPEPTAQEAPVADSPIDDGVGLTQAERVQIELEDNRMEVEDRTSMPSTSKEPEPTPEEPTPNLSEADTIDFKGSIKYICDEIIPRCLALLEKDTKLVFGIAELLTVFINEPVASDWVQNVLIKQLLIADLSKVIDEVSDAMENAEVGTRFASTLHLLCLLWQKFDTAYLEAVLNSNFYKKLAHVFTTAIEKSKANAPFVPPLLLWLDLFEKEKRLYERRKLFNESIEHITWMYWQNDERYGANSGWKEYSLVLNASLNTGFKDGKTTCRITMNEKPAIVDFVDMTQRYLESSAQPIPVYAKAKLVDGFDIQKVIDMERGLAVNQPQHKALIKNVITMLKSRPNDSPLEMDHIFSALSLLLNLITGNVEAFVEADGIPTLLSLECSNTWPPAMTKIIILIFRCCLDDANTLTHAYEKILRQLASGSPISVIDASSRMFSSKSRKYQKDWRRALHQLMPLCSKNASTFIAVMQQMAKHKNNEIQVTPQKSEEPSEPTISGSNDSVMKLILSQTFKELMSIDQAHQEKRVMRDGVLLQFIAELLRSYKNTAHILVELKHEKRTFVVCILEDFLGRKNANDITIAVRAVVVNLASSNSAKAHELLVNEIRSTLHSSLANMKQQELCDKVMQLARLVLLIRDTTQAQVLQRSRESIKHQYSVLKLMYKKNLVIDFAKAIWYLPLQDKMSSDALNTILRMFEELARVFSQINAPAPTPNQSQPTITHQPRQEGAEQPPQAAPDQAEAPPQAPMNQQELEGRVASALAQLNAHVDQLRNAAGIENDEPAREDQFDEEDEDADALRVGDAIYVHHHGRVDDSMEQEDEEDEDEEDDYDDLSNSGGSNAEHDEESSSEDERVDDSHMPDDSQLEASAMEVDASAMDDDRSSTSSDQAEMEHDDHTPHRMEVQLEIGDETIRDIDEEEDEDEEREEDDTEPEVDDDEDEPQGMEEFFDADYLEDNLGGAIRATVRDGFAHTHRPAFIPPPHENFFDDFEMLAASANYFADFLAGRGDGRSRFMGGLPMDIGVLRSGPIGGMSMDADPIVSQHPLLLRPPLTLPPPIVAERPGAEGDNLASMHNYALRTILIGDHDTVTIADRDIHHGRHRYPFHRLLAGRRVQGLRRQGALRRWHHVGGTNRDDYPRELLGHLLEGNNGRYDFEINSDRRIVDAFIPFFLDRLLDQATLLDPLSAHCLAIVVFAYLTKTLEVIEERPEKRQEKVETTSSDNQESSQANISVADTTSASVTVTTSTSENPPTEEAPQPSQASNDEPNPEDTEMHSVESIDSSDLSNRFAGVATGGDDEDERSRTPIAQETSETTETVAEGQANDSTVGNTSAMEVDQPVQNPETQEEANPGGEAPNPDQPVPSNVSNEYREILGDIEIPEGVDPAFLAALPEDIREEVIREELRRQRIQQANRSRTVSTQPSEATQGNVPAATTQEQPVEEGGLDPEFMAALPPEMQEEVLAQHEARLAQQRQEQAAAANAQPGQEAAGNAQQSAEDVAALFESLPPGLRAQVLADMDDSMIPSLPQNLADEARRLRSNWEQQQLFRIARMLDRPQGIRAAPHGGQAMGNAGPFAPFQEAPGSQNGVQIFDQESIVTLFLLYFMDQERFNLVRFQKLLKIICTHPGTCDFTIWCLLSMLKVLTEETQEEDMSTPNNGWIDHFQVKTALSQSEKALRVKDKVVVHNLVKQTVCGRVLETLIFIARNFPSHFLPQAIRFADKVPEKTSQVPELDHFWTTVKKINKQPQEGVKPKPATKNLHPLKEIVPSTFDLAPISVLLENSSTKLLKTNSTLFDKMLRLLYTISTALPDDAVQKRNLAADQVDSFTHKMSNLIRLILDGACVEEGLKDGRNFVIQVMRSMTEQRSVLFEILYDSIKQLGLQLHKQIEELLEELQREKKEREERKMTETPTEQAAEGGETSQKPSASTSSHDIVLPPALKAFTARNNQPKKLLKSLETISYIRNQLQALEKRRSERRPPPPPPTAAEEKKEGEDEKPAEEEAKKNEPEEIAKEVEEKCLQSMLETLNPLWSALSNCLEEVSQFDSRAVMTLQNAAEAFFLAHAFTIQAENLHALASLSTGAAPTGAETPSTSMTAPFKDGKAHLTKHTQRMLEFAEKHRTVLNQILRGNTNNLMEENAFSILTYFPKLLDFDVKRKYFYKEIRKLEDRIRFRHEDVAVRIRRSHLFYDSFRELIRLKSADWKARFYIIFEGEEGQDAGGLLREWYSVITREIFNENYALFQKAPGDRVTYMINKASHVNPEHLDYFKFVGRIIAKAIYDNKQLDCYFTRAFYKHILSIAVRYQDIESEDPDYFKSLQFLLENPVETIGAELNFAVEVEEFGVRSLRQLKENGSQILVTDENKEEYVKLVCQMKMTGSIRKQIDAFLEGFYEIIPKKLISIFNEQELELLVSGLPEIDIDDLCNNTEYKDYTRSSPQIQWFWRALRSFEQEDMAKFLQFVTGTSKVPLQGFSQLEGMNGVQKFTIHSDSRSTDRLPSAHTCFNQLDLPQYETYEKLRQMLLLAIRECSEGFAFA